MNERRLFFALLCGIVVAGVVSLLLAPAMAETRWALCRSYVNVRSEPNKRSTVIGFLDAGDAFETDGTVRNGYVLAQGIGESEGWIYSGYTSDEPPVKADERYVCVARRRVACRRWADGPRISGKCGWMYTGSSVKVYYWTSEWAVTSRGYIASEWLERDPE